MPDFTPENPAASASSHGFVTISDSADNPRAWRYLLLTASAALKIRSSNGTDYIIPALPAGTYFMGSVVRVFATGAAGNAAAATTVIGFY